MGVTALVLGIISTVIAAFVPAYGWVGTIMGVVGIILGALAKKNGQKCAAAGLVMSIIGTALGLLFYIACVACAAAVLGAAGAM